MCCCTEDECNNEMFANQCGAPNYNGVIHDGGENTVEDNKGSDDISEESSTSASESIGEESSTSSPESIGQDSNSLDESVHNLTASDDIGENGASLLKGEDGASMLKDNQGSHIHEL